MEYALPIILGLVSFLQLLFMFTLARVFNTLDKLRDEIAKVARDARRERDTMRIEYTNILDKHYVTTGQLNTLEKELKGEIRNLSTVIRHLTKAINNVVDREIKKELP